MCSSVAQRLAAVESPLDIRLAGFIKMSPFYGSEPYAITATLVCYPVYRSWNS